MLQRLRSPNIDNVLAQMAIQMQIIFNSMVFKVRDKNIFWTRNGWKNNYYPRVFNMPRPINGDSTMTVRCRYDHHSYLRSNCALI